MCVLRVTGEQLIAALGTHVDTWLEVILENLASEEGPTTRGRRFSAGSRGRRGARASQDDWPRDWVALEACGSACSAPIPPPSLTPSPERGSPQVAWGLPVHQEIPLNSVVRNLN